MSPIAEKGSVSQDYIQWMQILGGFNDIGFARFMEAEIKQTKSNHYIRIDESWIRFKSCMTLEFKNSKSPHGLYLPLNVPSSITSEWVENGLLSIFGIRLLRNRFSEVTGVTVVDNNQVLLTGYLATHQFDNKGTPQVSGDREFGFKYIFDNEQARIVTSKQNVRFCN